MPFLYCQNEDEVSESAEPEIPLFSQTTRRRIPPVTRPESRAQYLQQQQLYALSRTLETLKRQYQELSIKLSKHEESDKLYQKDRETLAESINNLMTVNSVARNSRLDNLNAFLFHNPSIAQKFGLKAFDRTISTRPECYMEYHGDCEADAVLLSGSEQELLFEASYGLKLDVIKRYRHSRLPSVLKALALVNVRCTHFKTLTNEFHDAYATLCQKLPDGEDFTFELGVCWGILKRRESWLNIEDGFLNRTRAQTLNTNTDASE
ncbi:hypothetical protein AA313_de0200194 [Arthrobotrys entomopaga]|nr:hypothetical protein AA313_de0200194 [Arthrobotrys entomopaga]